MIDYAIEADAFTGAGAETLRYAMRTLMTGPAETPPSTPYHGRIVDPGMLSRSILENGVLAQPSAGVGAIVLNNQDGALDRLLNYGFDGRPFVLREVRNQSPLTAPVVLRGVMAGIDTGDAWRTLRLRLRDALAALQAPLLSARYAGTTTSAGLGVEGDAAMKDQIKPLVLGAVTSVAPKPVNVFDLVYQVSVAAVSSIQIYDGAVPLTPAGDFPTAQALLAWAQVPGRYATCLAAGLFRLGGSPAFQITADVVEGAALADRSAARVARRLLDRAGAAYHAASFEVLHAKNPAEVGIWIDADTQADQVIGQVLVSVGAALIPNGDGVLRAVRLEAPTGEPETTFTLRDISASEIRLSSGPESAGVPAWSVELEWGRVWQTASAEDVTRAGITTERAGLIQTPNRKAVASDAAVRTAHPLAATVAVPTLLTTRADAEAEAARLLALYKVRRDRLTLTLPDTRGRRELGSIVGLRMPRFGYDAGKPMLVVSRQDDFRSRTVQLGLWG